MSVAAATALAGQALPARRQAAPVGLRRVNRRRGCTVRAASDFAQLRATVADTVAAAQGKLPALEQAAHTASRAREPAAEAERHWQELHSKLTALQQDMGEAAKALRLAVAAAAGGEAEATHALLQAHVKERLESFRVNHGFAAATDWKEFAVRDLPLHSIPGGRMLYKLAAAEVEGQQYAVVALGIANPFLFDNLRSLLLHWGVSEGLHAQWAQPPRGWHTTPGVSTPVGDRAWETVMGAFAPVMGGEQVTDATAYSLVLQVPLAGVLELRGGVKCVMKRTDHGQPEWIKAGPHNNGDFWLDFQPAIAHFDRKRKAIQEAAIAKARAEALVAAKAAAAEALEAAKAAAKAAPAGGRGKGGSPKKEQKKRSFLLSWDEVDTPESDWEPTPAELEAEAAAALAEAAAAKVASLTAEEPPEVPSSAVVEEEAEEDPALPGWVSQVEQFVQLSDLPQERSQSRHLKCLRAVAAAVGDNALLQRCGEVDGMLQQVDLLELSSKAAQQEKEQLQATLKGAQDEQHRLMQELTAAADAARRTTVRLRGRETELTLRDLEAVAKQAAEELTNQHSGSSGGGFWPFNGKNEERQLVFVEQKMMEVSGMDAFLVVQVFVEGTRAAVEAATAPPPPPPAATSSDDASDGDGAVAETDASLVATAAAAVGGQDTTAAGTVLAAAAEAAEAVGLDKKGAKKKEEEKKEAKKKKEEKEERPGFDHVVLGVAVAEKFPDGRLKSPLILHLGCVAHQGAKWQIPPEHWTCTPDAVSAHGAAAQVPFQRYAISAEDGSPVLINPYLFALALRMPLKDCIQLKIRGVEMVLKTPEGQWLSWQQGQGTANYYAPLPL